MDTVVACLIATGLNGMCRERKGIVLGLEGCMARDAEDV
jgi:hypothetical protein